MAPAEYASRRRELSAFMDEGSIAIVPGANPKIRNGDVQYPFRQDSDFRYL
ncbi:MAG: Xaa-Pro aminopeptidase, partial [Gammaproteobacteria bacterium]|nr:Xaa-Pro aminopeptidase [Gammaproteobacteria bacterium]